MQEEGVSQAEKTQAEGAQPDAEGRTQQQAEGKVKVGTIGVVGLGLIGASMAKTIRQHLDCRLYGYDLNQDVMQAAEKEGVIDGVLDDERLETCRYLFIALYPAAAVDYVSAHGTHIGRETLVMDLCGVKRAVCIPMTMLAEQYDFSYIGGHPMAGTEKTGYQNSRADMFDHASMILVPCRAGEEKMEEAKRLVLALGFGKATLSTMEEHDRIIAYTSQLAHVVSNAYVKSPTALLHHGFSAGSYRDLTRVAWLNETMWTELFLDNDAYLLEELDTLIETLGTYRDALLRRDRDGLKALLKEGRERKEKIDRK